MINKINMNKAQWVMLLVVFLFAGCYNEKEGCLDPVALNFDVSADKDCCCTYPKLKLKVNYTVNDTTSFSKLSYFEDVGGQVYKIESFAFFLSHVEMKGGAGEWIDGEDSSEQWVFDMQGMPQKVAVSSNVVLIEDTKLTYDFGKFADYGSYDSVRFVIGMDDLQKTVIPDSLPEGHALGFGVDSMWVSPKVYLQQKWIVVTDTSVMNYKVDTFLVSGENVAFDLVYTPSVLLPKGEDYELKIKVNIVKWLKGIDWQGDLDEISSKLGSNSTNAISLVQ